LAADRSLTQVLVRRLLAKLAAAPLDPVAGLTSELVQLLSALVHRVRGGAGALLHGRRQVPRDILRRLPLHIVDPALDHLPKLTTGLRSDQHANKDPK